MTGKKSFERLSSAIRPVNYCLSLQPDLNSFDFRGSEQVHVEVNEVTNLISVNAADIEVQKVSYQAEEATDKISGTVSYDADDERVNFTFAEDLQIGEGTLCIDFTGKLNDKMKGFYRSKYTSPCGKERYAAVTQFEATDARRAFPCWDEPAIKATFDITLIAPKDRVALSNMPVIKEEDFGGDTNLKVLTYQRTPIMSTYLLAFVIGEYDYVEAKDEDGVLVRVYTPLGKQDQGKFALDVAVKTLPFYKNYFKISYPLPKMDLIAIADFAAGAMENWGLVTYRETALLVDPENSSAKVKQWVALVVGHELAHQWFGNLVTMEWWTHLWLNEGFASWIEYLCVDYCFPEFDIWTQFVNQDLGRALELDALDNSHPIEVAVGHPSEIDEIFDAISYSKGASVIRMLHNYIGDEAFRKGMHSYLEKFKYKNAVTEDLWQALEKASGKPVEAVMKTWTKQMGFPVLKVSQSQNGSDRVLQISQEKFCANGKKADGSYEWLVPITVSTVKSPTEPVETALVEKDNISITVPDLNDGDWVKLNSGTVGVYRVQYSSPMLHQLIPALRTDTLQPRDRLGLQSDLFALARAGSVSTVDVLKCAEEFKNEEDFTVWTDLSINLSSVATILQSTDFNHLFQAFTLDLYQEIMTKLGWDTKDGESHLNAMLRELVITKLGYNGYEPVVKEALRRFEEHYAGTKSISADLRAAVYITVLMNGNREIFNKMLELYNKADSQEEQVRISRALGSVKDEELINEVLNFAISEKVRSQDTVFVIAGATRSYAGKELAWKFVQENWKMLNERYTGGFLIARLVKTTTEHFTTTERAAEIEKFFAENPAPAAQRTVQQSCENICLNARWLERDAQDIKKYLESRK